MPDFVPHINGVALLVVVGFCAFVAWLSYRIGYRDGHAAVVEEGAHRAAVQRTIGRVRRGSWRRQIAGASE